jgi:hypothetical protein
MARAGLVGAAGFEPTTSYSQSTCATVAPRPDWFHAQLPHIPASERRKGLPAPLKYKRMQGAPTDSLNGTASDEL